MRVAVPVSGAQVAPTADFAGAAVVAVIDHGTITDRVDRELGPTLLPMRAARIRELGVNVLICEAISNPLATMIWYSGIDILTGIRGEAGEVMKAFAAGQLNVAHHRMPGWMSPRRLGRGPRRYRFGQRGSGWGGQVP